MGAATAEVLAWDRGAEVPEAFLEEDAFNGLGESERAWIESTEADASAMPKS